MTNYTNFPNGLTVEGGLHLAADTGIVKKVGAAFAGGTLNGHGDYDGSGNPVTLFTVVGVVELRIFGVCNVDLAGASGTVEVGVAGNTAALIALTVGTTIDANTIWLNATLGLKAKAISGSFIVTADIIETCATANITAGQIDYYCIWRPISSGATVVAA